MKLLQQLRPLFILIICLQMTCLQGCLELTSPDDFTECGEQLACPSPKKCVDQICRSECIADDECEEGQKCESLRCVPSGTSPNPSEQNTESDFGSEMSQSESK